MTHEGQSWETQELSRWLAAEPEFARAVRGMSARDLQAYVQEEQGAPEGFYRIFATQPHPGDYDQMDWREVAGRMTPDPTPGFDWNDFQQHMGEHW